MTSNDRILVVFAVELTSIAEELLSHADRLTYEVESAGFGFGLVWHNHWFSKLTSEELAEQRRVGLIALRDGLGQGVLFKDEWRTLVLGARERAEKSGKPEDAAISPYGRMLTSRAEVEIINDNTRLAKLFKEKLSQALPKKAPLTMNARINSDVARVERVRKIALKVLLDEFYGWQQDKSLSNRNELFVTKKVDDAVIVGISLDVSALRQRKVSLSSVAYFRLKDGSNVEIDISCFDGMIAFLTQFETYGECEAMIRCSCFMIRLLLPQLERALQRGTSQLRASAILSDEGE